MTTAVSVVTPSYNRAHTLSRAIDSVLTQTFNDVEHIIVDDGSTDNTPSLMKDYNHPQIKYHRLNTNQGACVARNKGIELASSEWVSFLDSDDALRPEYLETVIKRLKEAPEVYAGAYTSYAIRQSNNSEPNNIWGVESGSVDQETVLNQNPIGSLSATTFRRDIMEEVGGFDPSFQARQDLDLYVRILEDYEMIGINKVLLDHYRHDDRISADFNRRIRGHDRFVDKHGEKMSAVAIANTHYQRGHHYADSGDICTARKHFWEAVRRNPTNPRHIYFYLSSFFGQEVFNTATLLKEHVSEYIE